MRSRAAKPAARRRWPALCALPAPLLSACSGVQSVLNPQGPAARDIDRLWWIMHWGGWAVLALVMILALWAVLVRPERRPHLGERALVVGGGLALPIVVLTALLVYGFTIPDRPAGADGAAPLRIEVTGKRWWWEVHYPAEGRARAFTTANEIRVPVGRPVEVTLIGRDVIHSFWVPALSGKLDIVPGHRNVLRLEAERPGLYRGQCAEFCGAQHANMAFYVVAQAPPDFAAWRAKEARPASEPDAPQLVRGRDLFLQSGCIACHTIRGTPARGQVGPDLTHVGGRLSLAAGILPNNRGTLAGWIADAQDIKPDNLMPSFDRLDGEELRALAGYLESLE